jgi:hypothetical protein
MLLRRLAVVFLKHIFSDAKFRGLKEIYDIYIKICFRGSALS